MSLAKNVKGIHEADFKEYFELDKQNFERLEKGEKISLLDFITERNGRKIIDHSGAHFIWSPRIGINFKEERLFSNLADFIIHFGIGLPLLVPLNLHYDRPQFLNKYGLTEKLFDVFKELIENRNLIPFFIHAPIYYRSEVYKEILNSCEKAGFTPAFIEFRTSSFTQRLKLIETAIEKKIPVEEGEWPEIALKERPEYSLLEWEKKVRTFFSKIKDLRVNSSNLYNLSIWGFKDIANYCFNLLKDNTKLGVNTLWAFNHYLIDPISRGLSGTQFYSDFDIKLMYFLKIKSELLQVTPADLYLMSKDPIETKIVLKPDEDEFTKFLKKEPDKEVVKNRIGIQKSAWNYDFKEMLKHYQKLREKLSEQYNEEISDHFKKSRIVGCLSYCGIGTIIETLFSYNQKSGLSLLSHILKNETVEEEIDFSQWLIKKVDWPFKEKGFPYFFFLWNTKRN